MYRRDMFWFWEDARAWLADRDVYLYETSEEPVENVHGERWLRPLTSNEASPMPPYAFCIRSEPSLHNVYTSIVRRH